MEKENCKKYLRDHITRAYKKSTHSKANRVDIDWKKIVDKLLISDRVDKLQKCDAYITIKGYK